jgi:hypothetical protein
VTDQSKNPFFLFLDLDSTQKVGQDRSCARDVVPHSPFQVSYHRPVVLDQIVDDDQLLFLLLTLELEAFQFSDAQPFRQRGADPDRGNGVDQSHYLVVQLRWVPWISSRLL